MSDDRQAFARLVEALKPYLAELVLVGGWAQQLYPLHPLARPLEVEPLRTSDVDVAAPLELGLHGEGIAARLKRFGFAEDFVGDDRPPVTEYRLGGRTAGFVVEFVAAQTGAGRKRGGMPDNTAVVAGVSVQKLPFVDLLLLEPSEVIIGSEQGFPLERPVAIRIPNPSCYIAQKLLVIPMRSRDAKDAKDLLYIYDTILRFADRLDELRTIWSRCLSGASRRARERFDSEREALADKVELAQRAHEIARKSGRPLPPSPDEILALCVDGMERIFART